VAVDDREPVRKELHESSSNSMRGAWCKNTSLRNHSTDQLAASRVRQ
jgi:hypothetical protein